jgi:hypothetical protein
MGDLNSSITRVWPFFSEVMTRPTADWLPRLLASASRSSLLPPDVLSNPGELLDGAQEWTYEHEETGISIELSGSFERRADPPAAFLRWLINNPCELEWPAEKGEAKTFAGADVEKMRRQLICNVGGKRDAARMQALKLLDQHGARGSGQQWWAFEGSTSVDCWLETSSLVLLVEGKRTDTLSKSTAWFPKRNQLVRNLEVAREQASDKTCAVMMLTDSDAPQLTVDAVKEGAPHLHDQAEDLLNAYVGGIDWATLWEKFAIPFDPPEDVPEALSLLAQRFHKEPVLRPSAPASESGP